MAFNVKMFITPLLVYIVNSADIDWTDETYVLIVRSTFAAVIAAVVLLKLWLFSQVNKAADERRVKIKPTKLEPEGRDVSVREHDIEKLSQALRTLVMGVGITVILHIRNQWVLPMIIQIFHQPLALYDYPLFKIFVLGYKDTGDSNPLKRPWAGENPVFADIWKQAQMMSDPNYQANERKAEKKKAGKLNKQLQRSRR
ncbi:hypothetical protein GUITHDRAFT_161199 [Guillardia theta CCMP2712]|uniref:Uncharacterized protein n=1 Tax=Guillardia theta (strain CCMP2712) TaxID=905079 RepID=L1JVQ7_GUITC|nr:hypothetical protein GUITHDRAFT_161199 [Guillardia theta CCMP2712]EKX52467.1 hypothetical protein GUITHDRAFT_161199 [Guillardia theta CCMP2712]|mmetsp:Transcript_32110/g.102275  ORF Transcript_32110/g.102275 Transcript_32110/m.102275 type:complete len:199 (-) Transcript_32110:1579-2175(-)|eukprot:XP_005839447.1 hypothetical protein GUITHDRAFT_161199 [Guillardia theta CCMP2712]